MRAHELLQMRLIIPRLGGYLARNPLLFFQSLLHIPCTNQVNGKPLVCHTWLEGGVDQEQQPRDLDPFTRDGHQVAIEAPGLKS